MSNLLSSVGGKKTKDSSTEQNSSQQKKVDLETLFKNLETLTSEECYENAGRVLQSEYYKYMDPFVTFLESLVSLLQCKPQTQEPTKRIHKDKYREAFLSFLQSLVCFLQRQLTTPEHNSSQQKQMEPTELFQMVKPLTSEECYQNAEKVYRTEPDKYMEPFVTFLQSLVDALQHNLQTTDDVKVMQILISFLQSLVRALQSQLQTPGSQIPSTSSPSQFLYNKEPSNTIFVSEDVPGPSTLPSNNTTQNKAPAVKPLKAFLIESDSKHGSHLQLLDQLNSQGSTVLPTDLQQCNVILLFCPLGSRIGSDVETAVSKIPAPALKPLKVFLIGSDSKHSAHLQLLDQLNSQGSRVLPTDLQQCDVILLFCPLGSRIGSNVETAVSKIPDEAKSKPVILVLMHHTRKPDKILDKTQWSEEYPCINHEVRVLYHETKYGLLQCPRNQEAVQILQRICDSYAQE